MNSLFPPIDPWASGMLQVDARHSLYWEQCGRQDQPAILFLHGGPGGGCGDIHRCFFDPERWRIVLFDQRGSGRSRPYAEIEDNTTQDLISDIEKLRQHLGIERWALFGGSWGSTLALAYAQAFPLRVLGFVLRGVFLFRQSEVDWFLSGMGRFFPEAEQAFLKFLPAPERKVPLASYYRRLAHPDGAMHRPAARAWCAYEEACSRLLPLPPGGSDASLSMSRIEAHYMINRGFMTENAILDGMNGIRHLPGHIVQGRYDVICPPRSAWDLKASWPMGELHIVPDGGHSALDPPITRALVGAAQKLRDPLK
ncbi:putative proline iminopeptidase [Rhodospirillaceae bacterium LM-1]|nr:putative proline iminopeptidase [Rhodospirillaceae bacterium LM-1]